jgi:uncharacterized protein YdaU (DUF1376 family)
MAQHKVDIYMPLYVRDFLTSTLGWSAEERGHYLTLLMVAWDRGSLPAELDSLERLSQGVTAVWPMLADKFPVGEDGQRRNARLEHHRERCVELKEKRVEAARRAASAKAAAMAARANAEQTQSKRTPNAGQTQSNREAIVIHPTSTSTSTPTSSLREERNTHTTHAGGISDFSKPGWAADEWDRFVSVWNATERATPWTHLTAPSSWVDHAAAPGWLDKAHQALARLPSCHWFRDPLAVTRFFEYVDRILAGEFDQQKQERGRVRQPAGGNL